MYLPPTRFSLATFTSVSSTLGYEAIADVDTARRNLETTKNTYSEALAALEHRTNHFIQYGWADLREYQSMPVRPFHGGYGHKCWSWKQYFRHLAKDMQRPLIYVVKLYNHPPSRPGAILHIPRRKYLDVLSASFFLLDQKQHTHNTVEWQWWLEPGMFEQWCDLLRTDPAMQEALWRQRVPI